MKLPPEIERAARGLLLDLGRVGAKALASGIQSVAGDVRKKVREIENRVAEVQGRAGHLARELDDEEVIDADPGRRRSSRSHR